MSVTGTPTNTAAMFIPTCCSYIEIGPSIYKYIVEHGESQALFEVVLSLILLFSAFLGVPYRLGLVLWVLFGLLLVLFLYRRLHLPYSSLKLDLKLWQVQELGHFLGGILGEKHNLSLRLRIFRDFGINICWHSAPGRLNGRILAGEEWRCLRRIHFVEDR